MAPMADVADVAQTLVIAPFPVPDDISPSSLTANLVCRVLFGLITNAICVVPLRLLYRNGEFSAVVFIIDVMCLNMLTVINALIWRNDNTSEWWAGYGWCDLHAFLYVPLMCLYTTSCLAISRNLSEQVNMLRANPLTIREKRRKNLVQALIMFPIPIIQLAWLYPLAAQRYIIITLVGCQWRAHGSWPYFVFFLLPAPLIALLSGFYSIMTFKRYRELRKTMQSALSSNSSATSRQNRTRRKLYFMTISILIPYVPIQCAHAVVNGLIHFPLQPFDFHKIRHEAAPFPWNSIVLMPSTQTPWVFLYNNYIPILTTLVIFLYFGITVDARRIYRRCMLAVGLGSVFPRLHNDGYDFSAQSVTRSGTESWGARTDTTDNSTGKPVVRESSRQLSQHSSPSSSAARPSHHPSHRLPDLVMPADAAAAAFPARAPSPPSQPASLLGRNPFSPFRTRLALPLPSFLSRPAKRRGAAPSSPSEITLRPLPPTASPPSQHGTARSDTSLLASYLPLHDRERVATRVWSDDDDGCNGGSPAAPPGDARAVTVETSISLHAR